MKTAPEQVRIVPSQSALLRQGGKPLNIPGKMMHRVGSGEDYAASGSEGQAYQPVAGDFEIRLALRRDLHNASSPGKRCGNVQIAGCVECQALRASQAAIKRVHGSVGIDLVNAIKA